MIDFNLITVVIVLLLVVPIISGALEYYSREKIQSSIFSLFDSIEFIIGILLSIYIVKKVLIEHSEGFAKKIYDFLPLYIKNTFSGQDVMTYIIFVPALVLLIMVLIRFATIPFYRMVVEPLAEFIYNVLGSMNSILRRMIGALSKIPRALILVMVFGLALNFFTYYFYSPKLTLWMNESSAYQLLYKNAIYPVLNSNLAKQIPVLVNDSFRKTFDKVIPIQDSSKRDISKRLVKELEKRNIKVIQYFNGVTLEEAIKSNGEIDNMARKIVGEEKNSTKKGYLLYKWISRNIKYDYEKAEIISRDPRGTSSGAMTAYETRKGICFDYSSLYVAMCRATGLKVRLITGLGYSGVMWGDHAWNQVYSYEEKRWINVDCTFGAAANYYDKKDFNVDHKDADVQGEW